ncbi:hypothetical protein TNCV_316041 [Trichonephila clavipes]|nr:hypothetical protein TNCV_316041 [Trichonephila clavipes]
MLRSSGLLLEGTIDLQLHCQFQFCGPDMLYGIKVRRSEYSLHPLHIPFSRTATAGSDVVQSGRPIFDDFFQHLKPYIGHNTANVVFQMVKRLWLIRLDQ